MTTNNTQKQEIQPPVSQRSKATGMSHSDSENIIQGRQIPSNIYRPSASSSSPILSVVAPGSAIAGSGVPDLDEMARALRNDVDLIYEFVASNIEFLPVHGSQKGALGTLIDGIGGSFDQSDLMVELLRRSGYTAGFMFGELELTLAEISNWLGTSPTDVWASRNLLNEGFVPNEVIWTGTEYKVRVTHCWVKCTISGVDYQFDPSRKTYTVIAGINLATAMGYSQTTFLTNAKSGATVNADYVQNMNRTNVRSNLQTYTTSLVNWIKNNAHGYNTDQIIGGKSIIPVSGIVRQTALPYLRPSTTPTAWTSIPTAYCASLRVLYDSPNIDVTFLSKDIHGKRLTLTFNGSLQCELRLDGTLIGTSSAQSPGSWNSVLLEPKHPYASTSMDQSTWMTIWAGQPHLIAQAWGNSGGKYLELHQAKLKSNRFNGASDTSEGVVGEALCSIFTAWDGQNSRTTEIVNRMTNCRTIYHHQVGVFGYYDTVYEDLPLIQWRTAALDNLWDNVNVADTAIAQLGIGLESAILDQLAGVGGMSATNAIDIATANGKKIYDARSSNWLSVVKPALTSYDAGTITNIENWWINPGHRVCLPENGNQVKNSWTGYGYFPFFSWGGALGLIRGTLKGASGVSLISIPNFDIAVDSNKTQLKSDTALGNPVRGSVNLANGQCVYQATDINIGSSQTPYSLSFGRTYRSSRRLVNSGLGLGWAHSHQLSAQVFSDGLLSLGTENPAQGAAAIAAIFVMVDLNKDLAKPMDKWVTNILASQWLIERLMRNIVLVDLGSESKAYTKLPDGSFARPNLTSADLTDTGSGTYRLTTAEGIKYNFNSAGAISTIQYPLGMTLTYSYTSGLLTTVGNGLGRTLTLNYTSGKLTSVSDGTGRSVTFNVDANKNLTQVTNPNAKSVVYEYDQPGRLTKVFLPANPASAVLTNTYDTLNRLKEQRDAYNNLWKFFIAGTRSEEENPTGNKQAWYFDRSGRTTKFINPLSKVWTNIYDGVGRLIKRTAPEGNSSEWTYDAKNNPLTVTVKPKPGSPLANKVQTNTYHPTFNKVQTVLDPNGKTWTMSYDAATGLLLSIQKPAVGSPAVNPLISFTYNARGQVATKTDETGIVTQFNYDTVTEKLTSVVVDFGVSRLNLTKSFGYNTRGDITSVTDARGKTTTATFDVLRRITQTAAPAPLSYITNFEYDDNDNCKKIQRETGDALNPWQNFQSTFTLDNLLATATDPDGHVKTCDYNSLRLLWKRSDELSRVTEFSYDAAGRLLTSKDPSLTIEETHTYSDNGQIATIKDAKNYVQTLQYDGFDRYSKLVFPDSTYEERTFDANDNVLSLRTRAGNTISYTYDALNRQQTRAPQGQGTVTNVYDLAGRLTKTSKPVIAGDASTGEFQFFFDTAGRVTKEKYPDSKEVLYQLDANGNVTRLTYPDLYFADRVYDELNRLVDVKLNGSASAALHFDYDKLSRRKKLTYGNGVVTDYTFELDNDFSGVAQTFVGSSVAFTYGFNNAHELTSQQISDGTNYMWHPSAAGTVAYGATNNLNQYPTIGGVSHTYNAAGCLTGDGIWTFTYDTENQLLTANKTGTAVTNLYDPLHRQREHKVGAVRNRFIYAGLQRIADYDNTTLLNRYIFGDGLDEPLVQVSASGTISYFHHDQQGSIIATTNSGGTVNNKFKYSPFGESATLSGTNFGYTGQRYEAESGLYFYKARYYSPKLGRFLQPDPLGFSAGLNLYTYVNNKPLTHTDPLGLEEWTGSIKLNGQVVYMENLHNLNNASQGMTAGDEVGAVLMSNQKWLQGPNGPVTWTPNGDASSENNAVRNGTWVNGASIFLATFYNMMTGTTNAVAVIMKVVMHTHNITPSVMKPYEFSDTDVQQLNYLGLPGIVVTQDGILIYHAPGSTNKYGEGYFDHEGGFHKTIYDENGNPMSDPNISDPNDLGGAFGTQPVKLV